MQYHNGLEIKVGDQVKLWDGCHGTVVCSLDTDEYSPSHTKADWGYLETGIIIDTDQAGLIHYLAANEDLELLSRAGSTSKGRSQRSPDKVKPNPG
jgi:hypothetical protein